MNKLKKLKYYDLVKYAIKYVKVIDIEFLESNGFSGIEVKKLLNLEDTKMANKKINTIKELKEEIKDLKSKLNSRTTKGFGWKGKDAVEFRETGEEFIITEHYKSKSSGKVRKNITFVSKYRINIILNIIKNLADKETKSLVYRDLASEIKNFFNFRVSIDAFNGGRNRAKYYFPYYYYPVKVLEYLKIIDYSGRGKITLINEKKKIKIKKKKSKKK